MPKKWTKADLAYLQRHGKSKKPEELARSLKTEVPVVQAKLAELGLAGGPAAQKDDPLLRTFGEALQALHRQDWKKAADLLAEVAADRDRPELAERARQYLAICRQRLDGSAKEPADAYLRALYEKNRGDFAAALDLCRQGGRDSKDDRFAYLAAAILAAQNRTEEAAKALARAVELNPKNRIHAFHDADFAELRKSRDHRHLFEV